MGIEMIKNRVALSAEFAEKYEIVENHSGLPGGGGVRSCCIYYTIIARARSGVVFGEGDRKVRIFAKSESHSKDF